MRDSKQFSWIIICHSLIEDRMETNKKLIKMMNSVEISNRPLDACAAFLHLE